MPQTETKRQWYLKNRERIIARACKRQKDKADEIREAHRRYRAENREKVRKIQRAWELRNIENERIRAKKRREAEPEKIRERHLRWCEANRHKTSEYNRKWSKANPGNVRVRKAERRARKFHATPVWVDRAALNAIYNQACEKGMEVDHIIPLAHPKVCGLHVPINLQLLTAVDNQRKGNRFPWPQESSL